MSSQFKQSIKDKGRKLVAFAAAAMLAVSSFASPALAEEEQSPVIEDPVSPFSTDPEDIIASCAGSISDGYGSLHCHLTSGNYYSTILVKSGPNQQSGTIDCYIVFPNGETYNLGTILASNDQTVPANFYICPYGDYEFVFISSTSAELEVQGFIFD